ncbi:ABC transporter permease [Planctomycetota bacterium]|nr:ABC transporter permease [Planctomycetota bacterium]
MIAATIARRCLSAIPTLLISSILVFVIIQLPPGDIVTSRIQQMQEAGAQVDPQRIEALRHQFHLDDPLPIRYLRWVGGMLTGNLGSSLQHDRPVTAIIGSAILPTVAISLAAVVISLGLAIPLGVWAALRRGTIVDHALGLFAYAGLALPSFLIALVANYALFTWFGMSPGGLFSPEYREAPWSLGRVWDLLLHLLVPVLILGLAGVAGTMRVMRANLLDELRKPYVTTARAKGVHPVVLVWRYPVRIAITPIIATVGWLLPYLVSGSVIIAVVLSLPTVGPILLEALRAQDMELAGAIVMLLSVLTVVGSLVSDILLILIDPRVARGQTSAR